MLPQEINPETHNPLHMLGVADLPFFQSGKPVMARDEDQTGVMIFTATTMNYQDKVVRHSTDFEDAIKNYNNTYAWARCLYNALPSKYELIEHHSGAFVLRIISGDKAGAIRCAGYYTSKVVS